MVQRLLTVSESILCSLTSACEAENQHLKFNVTITGAT